jgi:hypothetical protein
MRHIKLLLTSFVCAISLGSPALAADEFVTVTFQPQIQKSFVQMLSQTFKTPAPQQVSANVWKFKIPALRTRNQYAELFASLAYVADTDPVPAYQVADHINPQAVNIQPVNPVTPVKSTDYVPHEFLVKFKASATSEDIQFLNTHNGVNQLSVISGIQVHRLRLPQNLSVEEAVKLYNQSGIVEYAEPNYRMKIPTPVTSTPPNTANPVASATPSNSTQIPNGTAVVTQIPMDGGNQIIVDFRPNTTPETLKLFHQIYGTREVEKRSFYSYRLQLPMTMNPNKALRILMLHPAVIHVQRLYS